MTLRRPFTLLDPVSPRGTWNIILPGMINMDVIQEGGKTEHDESDFIIKNKLDLLFYLQINYNKIWYHNVQHR